MTCCINYFLLWTAYLIFRWRFLQDYETLFGLNVSFTFRVHSLGSLLSKPSACDARWVCKPLSNLNKDSVTSWIALTFLLKILIRQTCLGYACNHHMLGDTNILVSLQKNIVAWSKHHQDENCINDDFNSDAHEHN